MRSIFYVVVLLCSGLGLSAQAADRPFHCLTEGKKAIEPIEAVKRVLIEGRTDQLFERMDTSGLFSSETAEKIESEFALVYDGAGAAFCLPVQRNNFSDSFVSEIFMLETSVAFFYVVLYAFNEGDGWKVIRIEFNTSMSEMDKHIK